MAVGYRLFQARFGPRDSTGAWLKGGRWNSPGKNVLYASDSLAPAASRFSFTFAIQDLFQRFITAQLRFRMG